MDGQQARLLSPLNLAYIGDGIYELFAREYVLSKGNRPVSGLHKRTVSLVRATAQSAGFAAIEGLLTETESAVYRRGRNADSRIPKSAGVQEYHRATGVEALFGYLYLTGDLTRARELFSRMVQAIDGEAPSGQSREHSPEEKGKT